MFSTFRDFQRHVTHDNQWKKTKLKSLTRTFQRRLPTSLTRCTKCCLIYTVIAAFRPDDALKKRFSWFRGWIQHVQNVQILNFFRNMLQTQNLISTRYLPCLPAYWVFGSSGSDTRWKKYTRLLAFGLRRSHTRLKNTREFFFLWFYYVFISKGPRAAVWKIHA